MRAWQHHFAAIFGLEALGRVRGFSPAEMALPNHPDVARAFVRTLADCGYQRVLVQEHTAQQPDGRSICRTGWCAQSRAAAGAPAPGAGTIPARQPRPAASAALDEPGQWRGSRYDVWYPGRGPYECRRVGHAGAMRPVGCQAEEADRLCAGLTRGQDFYPCAVETGCDGCAGGKGGYGCPSLLFSASEFLVQQKRSD
jgi:hypothetical protein